MEINKIIQKSHISADLKNIAEKVFQSQRISVDEGLLLYEKAELSFLALLANNIREQKNGDYTYYIKNIHIEPTNICIHNCKFCSYSRKAGEAGAWEMSMAEIIEKIKHALLKGISEIHIVGGVHPQRDLYYYAEMISEIKKIAPETHIKAFTAIELDYMFKKSEKTYSEGFEILKKAGLNSIPGGGAEIFSENIRQQICENKSSGKIWLKIHEAAHKSGIQSNATMLYGHIENYSHRIDHLEKLRELQDKTAMFNAFIPLKYRNKNNDMSSIQEVTVNEDLRNYAVCRIFLDNFNHIKAYWPMIGKATTQLSLSFGVDDIDGTIEDSTKIYSMAGVEEQNPLMTTENIHEIIKGAKRIPVERDSVYNQLRITN
ncbi:MAG: aminofutalosine synthase MqnE [Bacteroidetes bacterium]|nr:aminofutalosine synthase MqnE [Bacteroidota bacterium]